MSELIRATSTRSWSLSRPLSERVADAEEVKPARSACTTELCAWLRQRTLLRLRPIPLRLGGPNPEAVMSLYAASSSSIWSFRRFRRTAGFQARRPGYGSGRLFLGEPRSQPTRKLKGPDLPQ